LKFVEQIFHQSSAKLSKKKPIPKAALRSFSHDSVQ
jgi:hypothetical protein